MTTALIKFDTARRALAEARTVDEVKNVRDKAEAVRLYARQQGESREMQNDIAEIKLRAERRLGELLGGMDKAKGGRPEKTGSIMEPVFDNPPTLSELGIAKTQSHRWQRAATIPEETFEAHIVEVKAKPDGELTSAGIQRLARKKPKVYNMLLDGNCYNCANARHFYDDGNRCFCEHYGRLVYPDAVVNCSYWMSEGPSQEVYVTMFSSETNEYYTPKQYLDAARDVMGTIDLDPASCKAAQENVKAATFFTVEDDGLTNEWHGVVWLNPPYGKTGSKSNQDVWANKLLDEYDAGRVTEAILLVKAAVGYNWFEELWDKLPVCFARARLSFVKENGSAKGQSKQGTAFFYLGDNIQRFTEIFSQFGRIVIKDANHETLHKQQS